jgi:acetyltransferase-like isoleucine patch superfamily enzyme
MLIFRLRDFLSVFFYRIFTSFLFSKFGKSVRIVYPLRIIGSKYISLHSRTTVQYGAFLAAIKFGDAIPNLEIKSGTLVGNFAHIVCTNQILIHENVLIADKVYISDNLHGYKNLDMPIHSQDLVQISNVEIGENSWIGENVCIIGSTIGKHCVIGANSVVTNDIGDYTIAVGSPARAIKKYCFQTSKWRKIDSNLKFID